MAATHQQSGPLAGLRVLDFGHYYAGPLAATLLADQGAEVIRIARPHDDGVASGLSGVVNAFLLRGRPAIELDLKSDAGRARALALIDEADVLIENFRPGVMVRLGLGDDVCRARNPGLVYCSLPGFGAADARASMAGWEGVVMAASCAYWRPSVSRDSSSMFFDVAANGVPKYTPLPLASAFAGGLGAASIMAALVARQRDGLGQRVEVPLFDAMLEANGVVATTIEKPEAASPILAFGTGLYTCADGRNIAMIDVQFRHFEALVDAAGLRGWAADGLLDYDRLMGEPEIAAELRRRLVVLFATRPAFEWERLLRPAGVPMGVVRTTGEFLAEPAMIEAGVVGTIEDRSFGRVRGPGAAVRLSHTPPVVRARWTAAISGWAPCARNAIPAGKPDNRPPLAGMVVLDLTRALAAPTCARMLGELGASVTKVEVDPATIKASLREPALHLYTNRGKRGAILDLKTEAGRAHLRKLAARADLIVTNTLSARHGELGLGEDGLRADNPGLLFTYLNSYTTSGPWAQHRGYAELLNAVSGIAARTSFWDVLPSGAPPGNDPPWPYTDSMAGILATFATLMAVYLRTRDGIAQRAEATLAGAAMLEQMNFAVRAEENLADPEVPLDTTGQSTLQRLYRATDGYVFLGSVVEDVPGLLGRLGIAGFVPGEVALIGAIEAGLATRDVGWCETHLNFGKTAVHRVQPLTGFFDKGGPVDRLGLLVTHYSEENGVVVTQQPVMHLRRTPIVSGRVPRPFGAETAEVLGED